MTTDDRSRPAEDPQSFSNVDDVTRITQLVLRERQGRDRGWWDQMTDTYWPDSKVRLSWYDGDGPGFVAGSQKQTEHGDTAVHHMFAPVVNVRGSKAHVEVSASTWSTLEVHGSPVYVNAGIRLNYRVERRQGEWRILSLDPIYEYSTLTPALPGQAIEIPADELAQYRTSYAALAWSLAQLGVPPSNDDMGDDRPDEVAAFYAQIHEWLDN
ncbi:nuclear transport factor 2 family protein [Microlunatus elymi]|nr:nuclear transport factor 2 family protein [Microlunatus elymi]